MKTWSAEIDGHVLMSGKRRAGLAKDAVPSIFEGAPRYLSKKIKSPRKQVKRQAHRVAPSTSTSHSGSSTEPMPTSPDAAVTHKTSDGSSLVFSRKALHVKSDMTVQAYVFGKQVGENWRHNRCPLVPPSGTICQFCSGLADTLRIHAGRRAARAKQDRPLKRIRLEVAPA
ncbi:hypothetical protein MRX96_032072 [Rhipicephalus microplus]